MPTPVRPPAALADLTRREAAVAAELDRFVEEGVDRWPDAGYVGCSSWADGVADLHLLHARDITFAMASPAPQGPRRADGLDGPALD